MSLNWMQTQLNRCSKGFERLFRSMTEVIEWPSMPWLTNDSRLATNRQISDTLVDTDVSERLSRPYFKDTSSDQTERAFFAVRRGYH